MKKNELSNVSEVKNEGALSVKSILFSLLISFGAAVILFLILALVVTYTSFKEENVNLWVKIIGALSLVFAGALASKRARTSGWLYGGIMGLIYNLILFMLSFFIFDELNFDFKFILSFILSFLIGAIGGIIGINMKK